MSPGPLHSPRDDFEPSAPHSRPGQHELRTLVLDHAVRWVPSYESVPELSVPPGTVSAVEPLVIYQQILAEIERHAAASPAFAFGVVYGAMYHCPRLKMDYALIEGVQRGVSSTESAPGDLRPVLEEMIAGLHAAGLRAFGWYRIGGRSDLGMSPGESAMHAMLFPEPWAVAILQDSTAPRSPAAVVRLTARLKPYAVPFYELIAPERAGNGAAVRSVIDWPTYRTTADVILPVAQPTPQSAAPVEVQQASQFRDIDRIFDAPPPESGPQGAAPPRRGRVPLFFLAPRAIRIALAAVAISLAIVVAWFATH